MKRRFPRVSIYNLRVFSACLLSFLILTAPIAPLAGSTNGVSPSKTSEDHPPRQPVDETREKLAPNPVLNPLSPPVGTITATLADDILTSAKKNPGDTITYTATITNNTAGDITGVQFNDTVDTHTTLVAGSSVAAGSDSYNAIGNVTMSIPDGSTDLLNNDFDPETGNNTGMTATAETKSSTQCTGGCSNNVTISADGSFTYEPPVGFTGTDTFTYTAHSGSNTATGTVNITVSGTIWFIKNDAASCTSLASGCGTLAHPFSTLAAFQGVNDGGAGPPKHPAANDSIFIYTGSGNYTGGTTLLSGQKLIGEGASASILTITGFSAPSGTSQLPSTGGTPPTIVNAGGNDVSLTNGSTGNTIRGLTLGSSSASTFAIGGTNFGTLTLNDLTINNGAGGALSLTTGTLAATIASITSSGAVNGISLTSIGGTLTVNGTGTISGATGAAFNVSGGTLSVTYSGNISQATAGQPLVNISGTHNTGTITFQTGTLSATNGTGLQFNDADGTYNFNGTNTLNGGDAGIDILNGSGGTFSFSSNTSVGATTSPTGTCFTANGSTANVTYSGSLTKSAASVGLLVDITNESSGTITFQTGTLSSTSSAGTGINLNNADGTVNFNGTNTLNGGDSGIDIITNCAGTFVFSANTAITSPSGIAYNEDTSTANVTYNGTITQNNAANAVNINAKTGGTTTFSRAAGGQITASTSTANAIDLTNTGGTVTFTGGLSLTTTSGVGFNATGSGTTVNTTQDNTTIVNTISSTTGTALNVANTTIGASGLTFRSISSNGASSGIVVNNTGSSGGLTVTGDSGSTNNGSGGTIQNTTSHGISLNNTRNVSLDQLNISTTAGSGIDGVSVTNFGYTNGTITGAGNSGFDSAIAFNGSGSQTGNNIAGTLTVTGNTFTNAFYSGLDVQSTDGTVTSATISNNTISNPGFSGINFNSSGTTTTAFALNDATINQNNISSAGANGIQISIGNGSGTGPGTTAGIPNDASNRIDITNNSITTDTTGTQAITFAITSGNNGSRGRGHFLIECNGKNTGGCTAPTANAITGSATGHTVLVGNNGHSTMVGTINNNIIDSNHTPGVSASNAISGGNGVGGAGTAWTPDLTLTVTNNVITDTDGNGILLVSRATHGIAKIKIASNNVAAPLSGNRPGIRVDSGNATAGEDDTVCLNITGNTSAGSGAFAGFGIGIRKEGTSTTTDEFGITNLSPNPATGTQAASFIAGLNTGGALNINSANDSTQSFTACGTAPPMLFAPGGVEAQDLFSFVTGFDAHEALVWPVNAFPFRSRSVSRPYVSASRVVSASLSQSQLDVIVAAAIERWASTGLTLDQVAILRRIKFEPADLCNAYLGEARDNRILVSRNAQGKGWFVDQTPQDDSEFGNITSATRRYTDPMSAPAGHVDLLTAIEHEIGHKLGLDDRYAQKDRESIMYGYLTVGERRLPAVGQAQGAKPEAIAGIHHLTLGSDKRSEVRRQTSDVRGQSSDVRLNHVRSLKLGTRNSKLRTATVAPVGPCSPSGINGSNTAICVDIGTLHAGDSITITFQATVNSPPLARSVSTQGTVSGSNFSNVLTDDPETGTAGDATVTNIETSITWTGATSTDWNDPTNWQVPGPAVSTYAPGVTNPAINDVVIPNVGAQPNIGTTDIGIYSLNLANGRTLTIGAAQTLTIGGSPGGDLTLNGIITGGNLNLGTGTHNLTNAGTGSITPTNLMTVISGSNTTLQNNLQVDSLTINAGGTLNITSRTLSLTGSFSNSGTFTTTGSTAIFNGSGAQTIGGSAPGFNNLTISNSGNTVSLGANTSVAGDLLVTSGTLDLLGFTANRTAGGGQISVSNGATLKIGGSNTFPSNYTANTLGQTSTVEYEGAGSQAIRALNYGNLTSSGGGGRTLTSGQTTGIFGTFTPGASAYTVTGSTVDFNGTGTAQTIPAFNFNNLTISQARGANSVTLVNGGTIGIAGTFSPTATFGGGGYVVTNNTVEYNGSSLQTLPSGFTPYNNLTINNPGGATGFAGLTVQGLLEVKLGTFTSSSTYNNVQVDSGGTLAGVNATTINVSGNWTIDIGGVFTPNGNTVNFNGSGAQLIGGTATALNATTFNNLTIANGGSGVSLGHNITVNGTLTLTNDLSTGVNVLIMPATASSTGAGDVVGNLKRTGFVSGGSALSFGNPLNTIQINSGTAPTDITVNLDKNAPTGAGFGFPGAVQRTYTITPNGGSSIMATLQLRYLLGEVNGNNEATLRFWRFNGTVWQEQDVAGANTTTDPINHKLKLTGVQTFSPWTFAGVSPTAAEATVSGQIVDASGNPVEGAGVRLTGTQNRLTVTDSNGAYRFENVETNGFYTVTPSRANFSFSPAQRSFSQLGQHTEAAFTAAANGEMQSPLERSEYFVRQQYVDFLNREPDEAGLNFWVNNLEGCGADGYARFQRASRQAGTPAYPEGADALCRDAKRTDTSAAFFFSTEFQQTGYLVYRMYRSAYGELPNAPVPLNLSEFKPDTQAIGKGVIALQSGWEQTLENNKQAFAAEFVQRAKFAAAYPTTMTPAEFVDKLFANAGVTPSEVERTAALSEFGDLAQNTADTAARGRALRRVAENSALARQEFNSAFVLMQYFGYLRRDPNTGPDTNFDGYNFWLTKLNTFNGNFRQAEMVKAFLVSGEYRGRFPR